MSEEQTRKSKQSIDARIKLNERVSRVLEKAPFRDPGKWGGFGDVRLAISVSDGFRVSMDVNRRVLADRSQFLAEKLRRQSTAVEADVEVKICDYDDVEGYVETACLEYLEAVPWSEEEEEKVISQYQLHDSVSEVLKRVSAEPSTSSRADDIFLNLLIGVLQAKDDKARREMKALISRLLREDASSNLGNHINRLDGSKDALYHLCHGCLSSLALCLSEAMCVDESRQDQGILMSEIAQEADNMQWIVDILLHKTMGDEFVKLWADQKELANLHSKIPTMYRHEISRIAAQLCVAIGRGQILVPKDIRYSLLSTWLEALYDDLGWMRRAS
ncbi:BTB/POZ domain-containing protein [Actinidia rufa]|uniref:BTB/POZ domain-containing protein n=1 Tax=Actinidia rufa TaxID=165716 RepID=A0A7J0HBR1_9ERIC|nr:BTB/POZ domain-containing protein [Actinidia rufa]